MAIPAQEETEKNSPLFHVVLFGPSMHYMMSTHSLLNQMLIFSRDTFTDTLRHSVLPAIWVFLSPAKLTHKIHCHSLKTFYDLALPPHHLAAPFSHTSLARPAPCQPCPWLRAFALAVSSAGMARYISFFSWLPDYFFHLPDCLSLFRLLSQNTADWVAHKQQKLICHSCGGWESEIRVPAHSSECPLSGRRLIFLTWQKGEAALWGLQVLPKAPPPNTITWRIRISTSEFGGDGEMAGHTNNQTRALIKCHLFCETFLTTTIQTKLTLTILLVLLIFLIAPIAIWLIHLFTYLLSIPSLNRMEASWEVFFIPNTYNGAWHRIIKSWLPSCLDISEVEKLHKHKSHSWFCCFMT